LVRRCLEQLAVPRCRPSKEANVAGRGTSWCPSRGLVGYLNLVILAGIVKVFRAMRRGEHNETELERQLDNRGFFYRFFGPWMKVISKKWRM